MRVIDLVQGRALIPSDELLCRLSNINDHVDGEQGTLIDVEDVTGICEITVPYDLPGREMLDRAPSGTVLRLRLSEERHCYGWVTSIEEACANRADEVLAVRHLGAVPSRARPALGKLLRILERLGPSPLSDFVARILGLPEVKRGLLLARASWNHHHAELGGLLVHTVEVMQAVMTLAQLKFPDQPWLYQQCVVAALVHDLGKVITHGPGAHPERSGPHHVAVGRLLVQEALQDLAQTDPASAHHLRVVLDPPSRRNSYRSRSSSVVAELLNWADQLSAMQSDEGMRKRFQQLPAANQAIYGKRDHRLA